MDYLYALFHSHSGMTLQHSAADPMLILDKDGICGGGAHDINSGVMRLLICQQTAKEIKQTKDLYLDDQDQCSLKVTITTCRHTHTHVCLLTDCLHTFAGLFEASGQ